MQLYFSVRLNRHIELPKYLCPERYLDIHALTNLPGKSVSLSDERFFRDEQASGLNQNEGVGIFYRQA